MYIEYIFELSSTKFIKDSYSMLYTVEGGNATTNCHLPKVKRWLSISSTSFFTSVSITCLSKQTKPFEPDKPNSK